MDGSTDKANVDDLVVIVYCSKDVSVEEVGNCTRCFSIQVLRKADVAGLIECPR